MAMEQLCNLWQLQPSGMGLSAVAHAWNHLVCNQPQGFNKLAGYGMVIVRLLGRLAITAYPIFCNRGRSHYCYQFF